MKKLLSAITISIGALMATSAMAAPQDYRDSRYQDYRHNNSSQHWNQKDRYERDRYDRRDNSRYVKPSSKWRRGDTLPRQFDSSRYIVDFRDYRHLTKPGRSQDWYKINGDFVLVDHRNGKIVQIIG